MTIYMVFQTWDTKGNIIHVGGTKIQLISTPSMASDTTKITDSNGHAQFATEPGNKELIITPPNGYNFVQVDPEGSSFYIDSSWTLTIRLSEEVPIPSYPAKITAVSVTPSPVTCVAPCNVTVTVVWRNDGGVAGTLTPAITVNGVRNALPALSLQPGLSVTRTFTVSGLATGPHTICPDPN